MPSTEQFEKMKEIWNSTPLCVRSWFKVDKVIEAGRILLPDQLIIVSLCPITALLRAAGVSDKEIKELEKLDIDGVWNKYKDLLIKQYGFDEEGDLFETIIRCVDATRMPEVANTALDNWMQQYADE